MFRKVGPVVVALFLSVSMSMAQNSRSEVSASLTGNFSKESDGQGVAQVPSQSIGFLGSYRFSLGPSSAVELNYAYTRNDQNYNFGVPVFSATSIQTNIHEVTGAYVFAPRRSSRLSPFLLAGGGALTRIIEPEPTRPDGWDLADAEAEGWGAADALAWLKSQLLEVRDAA